MKIRQCSKCRTPVKLLNNVRQFSCPKCRTVNSGTNTDLRSRVSLVRAMQQENAPAPVASTLDFSRRSFTQVAAPRGQVCSCGCGRWIERGQMVYVRILMNRGRPQGETRIIDLEEHYDQWFEEVAHKYVTRAARSDPALREYLRR